MPRSWSLAILVCIVPLICGSVISASDMVTESSNEVVQWNKTLLTIVRTPGAQPATVHPTRDFALLHAAIYDAVNAIDARHEPYLIRVEHVPGHASQEAAAASAAHETLSELFPAFQPLLDQQLTESLGKIPDGPDKTAGVDIGRAVGEAIVTLRSDDGSASAPVPYVFGTAPGAYQSTPPNFPKQPQFTHWSRVTPFALKRASQFRPGPPPALTSVEYAVVFNEVKSLGILNSTAATPDQVLIGKFWNGAIQNYWNEITQTTVTARHLTTAQSARVFALLNLTLADSVIAFYDAKYTYNFWRPVTAIRAAATDDNPQTIEDPNWLPEPRTTAPDPSYPGAHAAISAGGAFVLNAIFSPKPFHIVVTSEVLPGVTRSFDSFTAIEQEASASRIFAGQHFRSDEDAGEKLGSAVADFVEDNFLKRVHRNDDDDHEESY
ncbi:MAG: vanadium-dependent haloperoxidase [Sinobacteraceae bacterium]|nr:vanadium-dependent haloperoxidase [Nevskiaceae bacterium]